MYLHFQLLTRIERTFQVHTALYYTVLYNIELYCTALYCTVLYNIVHYSIVHNLQQQCPNHRTHEDETGPDNNTYGQEQSVSQLSLHDESSRQEYQHKQSLGPSSGGTHTIVELSKTWPSEQPSSTGFVPN